MNSVVTSASSSGQQADFTVALCARKSRFEMCYFFCNTLFINKHFKVLALILMLILFCWTALFALCWTGRWSTHLA